jgi:hypothetical protein
MKTSGDGKIPLQIGPGAEEELSEMDTEADVEIFLMWGMDGYGSKSMVTIVWGINIP